MRFEYFHWDDDLIRRLHNMSDLMDIYQYLLMRLGGNVGPVLRLMRNLQKQGILSDEYDIDEFERHLKRSGLIRENQSRLKLTDAGERLLRKEAFEQIFEKLRASGKGSHLVPHEGGNSGEPLPETRPFQFGDNPRHIDFNATILNSIKRTADLSLNMGEEDIEVHEMEKTTSCATVLLIDISHSMVLYGEDRITPARQVAMALAELILTTYHRDDLSVVLFGDFAQQVSIKQLPYIKAGPYHTNTQAGLRMARRILAGKRQANKQIFMITDGKPSMITRPNGDLYKNPFGLDPRIVNRTLDEAVICRRKKIPITTFMVTDDPTLQDFVARLTELNRGRAYFSSVGNLGSFVIWDFVSNRRRRR